MQYHYRYVTTSSFTPAVEWHFFKLRAVPCQNEFQRLVTSRLEVTPSCRLIENRDGQGNDLQWGSFDTAHSAFSFVSEGVVEQSRPYILHEVPAAYYRVETRLTSTNQTMRDVALKVMQTDNGDAFETAHQLMTLTHQRLNYISGSTTVTTTAAEAWESGAGVCQDFAHVMIALCRWAGLHARYVNGIIVGEGQTHAWVEVSDGEEWHPFDPTHNCVPRYGYAKIAHGRDADDCPTNRGRFYSWTNEVMTSQTTLAEV